MTPGPRTAFEDVAAPCPGFRTIGRLPARKSQLLAGELDGVPVLAKRLARPNAVWAWYLAREIAIYRAFAADPPPIRVPRLVCADDNTLVIERFTGAPIARRRRPHAAVPAELERSTEAPIARRRRPHAAVPAELVTSLLAARDRLARWQVPAFPDEPPPAPVTAELRRRMLEDPTAPVEWVRDGLARAHTRGIIDAVTHAAAAAALARHAPIAPSHGDLLLRNAFVVDGEVALVDWECAGTHIADWDLALLWSQLDETGRAIVEATLATAERRRAFLALAIFALCREVVFLEAFRAQADHHAMIAVRAELAATSGRLAPMQP